MRVLLLAALLTGCSVITETSDLTGGTRDAGGAGETGVVDAADSGTCERDICTSEIEVMLLANIAPCARETTDVLGCRAAIAAKCRAKDPCCFRGGYGPVDFPNANEATVLCLWDDPYTAPVSELTTANAKCLATALGSRDCDAAAHTSSKKRGHGTAILQSVSADTATLIGIDSASTEVQTVTFTELTKLEPGCTSMALEKQACTTAVHRFCANDESAYLAGIGPVSATATEVSVACIY